tara:strand:- start:6123 stop:6362 length:240 start_codon:yes stop_codon:yes gene_type:complete
MYELLALCLCVLAVLENAHWILIGLFLLHFINLSFIAFYPKTFYASKNDIESIGGNAFMSFNVMFMVMAGCLALTSIYL